MAELFVEAHEIAQGEPFEYDLVWQQRQEYIQKIDTVIAYLKKQNDASAQQLLQTNFLPKAHRRQTLVAGFTNLNQIDQAKHLGTLFIEELGDFITAHVDEFFSFTRYAEQIARSASNFANWRSF